ncbi:MAG: hypothetical protein A2355_06325 [Spirochaetes bacterium RIFOXYB1_FULL_32_8]|nr:MAG: hypothetical protein A2355_06325 [Spirochaetes bacterium RIFOXYB1_FULL_32_8]
MNALREFVRPVDHRIIIELPQKFYNLKEFEVIILPSENNMDVKKSRRDLYGIYEGQVWMSDDFNEPVEDFKEYMG